MLPVVYKAACSPYPSRSDDLVCKWADYTASLTTCADPICSMIRCCFLDDAFGMFCYLCRACLSTELPDRVVGLAS